MLGLRHLPRATPRSASRAEVPLDVVQDEDEIRFVSPAGELRWTSRVGPFALGAQGRLLRLPGGPVPVLGEDVAIPEGVDRLRGDGVCAARVEPVIVAISEDPC